MLPSFLPTIFARLPCAAMARYSDRFAPPGRHLPAYMEHAKIVALPSVNVEQAAALQKGAVLWLQWDSPGVDGHDEWFSAAVVRRAHSSPECVHL